MSGEGAKPNDAEPNRLDASARPQKAATMRGAGTTMAVALRRFLLDSIYVVVFFVVATTAAYGINRTVALCRRGGMEGPVVWIL